MRLIIILLFGLIGGLVSKGIGPRHHRWHSQHSASHGRILRNRFTHEGNYLSKDSARTIWNDAQRLCRRNKGKLRKIDYVIIVDATSNSRFFNVIEKMLDHFSISAGSTRVALITFGKKVVTHFTFDDYQNRKAVYKQLRYLRRFPPKRGSATLGQALEVASALFEKAFTRPETIRVQLTMAHSFGYSNRHYDVNTNFRKALKKLKTLRVKFQFFSVGNNYIVDRARQLLIPYNGFHHQQLGDNHKVHLHSYRQVNLVGKFLRKFPSQFLTCKRKHACSKTRVYYVRDECNRRCLCSRGRISKCDRVRCEINSMTTEQRTLYVQTYKTLTSVEPYKSRFRKFITIHSQYFFSGIHHANQFLPWHRWFILAFENLLREVDCRVTATYWDWSIVSHNAWDNNALYSGRKDGLGGRSPSFSVCVQDGPFSQSSGWTVETNQCLMRDLRGVPPDAAQVELVKKAPSFALFEAQLRINLHDNVHCLIGGHMCNLVAASTPSFFLHHTFVDKIWADVQQRDDVFKKGNFSGTLITTSFLPEHVSELTSQPGYVSVSYDPTTKNNGKKVTKFLKGLSYASILQLDRMPFQAINRKSMRLFKVTKEEWRNAEEFERGSMSHIRENMRGKKKMVLYGLEKALGFRFS